MKHNVLKVGDKFNTNGFGSLKVIKYVDCENVTVRFDYGGYTFVTSSSNIRRGCVRNPYFPSFKGIGFDGVGEHKTKDDYGKDSRLYKIWSGIFHCYSKVRPDGGFCTTVCERWHNFQNFATDVCSMLGFENTDWEFNTLLIYPARIEINIEKCCFVPTVLSKIFPFGGSGDLPTGVKILRGRYYAKCGSKTFSKSSYLGSFSSAEQAYDAYLTRKKEVVVHTANLYKDQLDPKIYKLLLDMDVHKQFQLLKDSLI